MSRPIIAAQVDADLAARLDALAARCGTGSRSAALRAALERGLDILEREERMAAVERAKVVLRSFVDRQRERHYRAAVHTVPPAFVPAMAELAAREGGEVLR